MILGDGPPTFDELEVNIFGPGYGESLAIHIGAGQWMLIDSCLQESGMPATSAYLDNIAVPVGNVKTIVASHWHDDHIAGLSSLVKKYSQAELFVPNYFSQKEGSDYVAAYSGAVVPQSRGTHEIYWAIENSVKGPIPTGQRVLIYSGAPANVGVTALALSPVPEAWGKAMAALLGELPVNKQQIKHASFPKTNIASIVIHIEVGEDAILLGSDLEKHGTLGWQAVAASKFSLERRKASLYKVAHHGSSTGDIPEIWLDLLQPSPVSAVTPYVNGRTALPKKTDVERIKKLSQGLYCTSQASAKPKLTTQSEQLLKGIASDIHVVNRRMGHWRFRKPLSGGGWTAKAGGAATQL